MDLNNIDLTPNIAVPLIAWLLFASFLILTIALTVKKNRTRKQKTLAFALAGAAMPLLVMSVTHTLVAGSDGMKLNKIKETVNAQISSTYGISLTDEETKKLITKKDETVTTILQQVPPLENNTFAFYKLGLTWRSETVSVMLNGKLVDVFLANGEDGSQLLYNDKESSGEDKWVRVKTN